MVRKGKSGSLHLRQIKHFMEAGRYLSSVLLTERNGIRKAAKSFVLEDEMYYTGAEGTEKRLVLFTDEEKAIAFEECHIVKKSDEHYGRTKTLERLKEKYYWTSMVEDIVAMMVHCKSCKFNKLNKASRYIRVTEPWEVVSIDILGQFPASDCGHAFVAVIIDMFTKYTVAVPLRDTTVSDVAVAIEKSILQLGCPRKFVSDQSEEFVRELNQVLELDKGLSKNVLAVTKGQMNRPDEAAVKLPILKHCHHKESSWVDSLPQQIYEINTTFITSSGHIPFYLMFHRSPKPSENTNSQDTSHAKPTFVVRDIERYLVERDKKAESLVKEVLTEHSSQAAKKLVSEEQPREDYVENISASDLFHFRPEGDHGYQRAEQEVPNIQCSDKGETNYAHVVQVANEPMISNTSGSVYEMADGEGQVVVVADDICGSDDGTEIAGQHMVIVQPGLGDQGLIMLSENKVIMHNVDSQQFSAYGS